MPDVSSGGLPRPLTSFIGRERELAQARRLLAGSYLVTLTGPGGSGKTRLGIALAARGLTNRDIAAQLFLSVRTVEAHVDHILTKLGFRTRTQLAAWAHEEGLLTEGT